MASKIKTEFFSEEDECSFCEKEFFYNINETEGWMEFDIPEHWIETVICPNCDHRHTIF